MGQTLSTTTTFPLSILSAPTRRTSKPRTKQDWKALRAANKAKRQRLREENSWRTMPESRKAVQRKDKRTEQQQRGQRKNGRRNAKKKDRNRKKKEKKEKEKQEEKERNAMEKNGFWDWVQLRCQVQ
jgi:hypothetical protein